MLTFILLVVLGGGVGLWVVALAESPKPATVGTESRRADVREIMARIFATRDETDTDGPSVVEADEEADPIDPLAAAVVAVPASSDTAPQPRAPRRPPVPTQVPRAYTAIEGRYADVAHVPLWRRVLSLVGIVVVVAVLGVGIAAVLGAVFALVAEILGNAIG